MKALVDYILEEDYSRYNELLDLAEKAKAEAKANHVAAPRGPMTAEQKKKAAENRLAKAKAQLEALLAAEAGETAEA